MIKYPCPECGQPMKARPTRPRVWYCPRCNDEPDHDAIQGERDQERMGRGDEPMVDVNQRRYGHKPQQP